MVSKIRIGIYGGASISAGKLMDILLRHPQAQIKWAVSETQPGAPVCDTHTFLRHRTELTYSAYSDELLQEVDIVFSCKRPTDTFAIVDQLMDAGKKLIDLSADYRLKNTDDFEKWYGKQHTHPKALATAVYGLPELHRAQICKTKILANPGCYTTASILACAPFAKTGLASQEPIIIDAVSGASGAGRTAKEENLFINVNENVRAYRIGTHQHTPEIEQELSLIAKQPVKTLFVPHVGPFYAGIMADCFIKLAPETTMPTLEDLHQRMTDFYAREPFVRIMPLGKLPQINNVLNTNFCDLGVAIDERTHTIIAFSAIDNLVKGAAGQAVENMNIMFGLPEGTGLM